MGDAFGGGDDGDGDAGGEQGGLHDDGATEFGGFGDGCGEVIETDCGDEAGLDGAAGLDESAGDGDVVGPAGVD